MKGKRTAVVKSIAAGLISAILVTLAGMLLMAGMMMVVSVGDRWLMILNQLLKIGSVILGTCMAVPRGGQRGLATGTAVALLYACIGYGMYAALGGAGFTIGGMLGEILICAAAGAVTGTIRANMQPNRRRKKVAV
ncbi:MAG: DUF3792 family protein [Clostridia bacterium]|nr:DUF3792 family protein [Clostridia bacterium]